MFVLAKKEVAAASISEMSGGSKSEFLKWFIKPIISSPILMSAYPLISVHRHHGPRLQEPHKGSGNTPTDCHLISNSSQSPELNPGISSHGWLSECHVERLGH